MATSKSPSVQAAVIAKHMIGESKSQISEDLGISRVTINNILSDTEVATILAEGKSSVIRLIPKSVKALERAIKRGKTTEEAQLVLRSTGVLAPEQSGAPSVNVNFGVFGG